MKKTLLWLTPVFLLPVLLGCSGGASSSGMTNVTVALGPLPSPASPATAGKASARSLRSGAVLPRATPGGLDNILLTVTGDGMTPIVTVITLSGSWDPADPTVVLLVPSGNNRRFLAEAWGGGEILYRGDNTVTLTGAPTTVDIYVYPPWRPTLDDTAYGDTPSSRYHHTAVWTGTEMIVWGGLEASTYYSLVTGARYDPVADTWAPTDTGFWEDNGLESHTAVWTGTEMIVWGGGSYPWNEENYGARYDPALDSWQSTSQVGVPFARRGHTAVWTGTEMIVWGGYGYDGYSYTEFNDGARYDPVADSWVNLYAASGSPPDIRTRHTAVWTGTEMIVWGGYATPDGYVYYNDGGRYDPVTETWSYISGSLTDAPSERSDHTAVWTGTEMIVWGGEVEGDGLFSLDDGARYTPSSDSWSVMNSVDAPYERSRHTAVWTGTQMIVWGGEEWYNSTNYGPYNDGGRYDPLADAWTPTSMFGVPTPRIGHTAVWAATQMIVWGGTDDGYAGGYVSTGGRYTPW